MIGKEGGIQNHENALQIPYYDEQLFPFLFHTITTLLLSAILS